MRALLCFPLALAVHAIALFVTTTAFASPLSATTSTCPVPGHEWKHATHAQQESWSASKLAIAHQYADSIHSAAVMIVQNGRVIDAWGDTSQKITTFSVRKSLISSLYGIYSANGTIDVNETLQQLGIDDSPEPLTPAERQARIVDLLRARSGIYHAASFETDFQRKGRPARGSHPPGTHWFYNNWDFNVLGTIFEQKTGLSLGDAFAGRIAKPTGMEDFTPADVYYLPGPVSIHPAYMFEMSTRDMARFGQLYLCGGRWGKQQVVPADWVYKSSHTDEMLKMGKMNLGGYEYLWWVEHGGVHLEGGATLPGMFSAQGAGGHYILDIPTLNAVIVYQFNNGPAAKTIDAVLYSAQKEGIYDDQFGHLVRLILEANAVAAGSLPSIPKPS